MLDRYSLGSVLAEGASSTVYEATDLRTGTRVALKALRPGVPAGRARRELTILRLLDEPGIPHLLDHGDLPDGRASLVLELVEGVPFPGRATPVPWPALAPVALSLLETLHRLHRCGVVHGDLSPHNVLVDSRGTVWLVDLGAAVLRGDCGHVAATTFAFAAPEVLAGSPATPTADVYGAGALLGAALAGGELPWDRADLSVLDRPDWVAPAGLPAAVAPVIGAMLSADPGLRPTPAQALGALRDPQEPELTFVGWGAWVLRVVERVVEGGTVRVALPIGAGRRRFRREVERRVGREVGRALTWTGPGETADLAPEPLDERAVRALFVGPDALGCLEDAAREVLRRTGGWPGDVVREVRQWVHRGWAQLEGGRVRVEPAVVERLAATVAVDDVRVALAAGRTTAREEGVRELLTLGERWNGEGRGGAALAVVEVALTLGADGALAGDLARLAVDVACYSLQPDVVRRASALLEPVAVRDPDGSLRRLLAAAEGARRLEGDPGDDAPMRDERLDATRVAMRVQYTLRSVAADALSPLQEEIDAWAERWGTDWARARRAGWAGQIAYQQGEFAAAAALHLASARGRTAPVEQMSAVLNAASAWLEAGRPTQARSLAEEALVVARAARHSVYAGRARWILRAAAYRAGEPMARDPDLEASLRALPFDELAGLIALTEAAGAWRELDHRAAQRLARLAVDRLSRSPQRWGCLLARALLQSCGPPDPAESARLLAEGSACPLPAIGIQVLGLVASSGARLEVLHHEAARRLVERVPPARRGLRLEVLAVDEALALVVDAT